MDENCQWIDSNYSQNTHIHKQFTSKVSNFLFGKRVAATELVKRDDYYAKMNLFRSERKNRVLSISLSGIYVQQDCSPIHPHHDIFRAIIRLISLTDLVKVKSPLSGAIFSGPSTQLSTMYWSGLPPTIA